MKIFSTIYSKFVTGVVILLLLIAGNTLLEKIFLMRQERVQQSVKIAVPENQVNETEEVNENTEAYFEESELVNDSPENVGEDQEAQQVPSITYQSEQGGENAFELLQEVAEIEYQQYDFGVFVESINGISINDQYFWALYVNGEQSQTGADKTILKLGDTVEWRYEAIK